MKLVLCPVCRDLRAVVGYKRDDPVLDCGHVLTVELDGQRSQMAESLALVFHELISDKVREYGGRLTVEMAERLVMEDIYHLGR